MNFLLDTNIVSFYFRGNSKVESKLLSYSLENIFISCISYFELIAGYANSVPEWRQKSLQKVEDFTSLVEVIGIEKKVAKTAGLIKADLVKKGQTIEDADLLIGATCLVCNLVLVTNNVKHFKRIPDLKIQDWTI
ncbi:MAG: type II toxin-antitoxin system VapC family toxin [bacterium]